MNEQMHSSRDHVAATLLAFAAGEAVATPYDGWSKPPTTEVVEHSLRGRLNPGWATRQLIATLTSLADNDGLDAAALSHALAAAADGTEPTPDPTRGGESHLAVPIPARRRNELASCASRSIAAGLWQRIPAAAAALGREQAAATERDDVSIDTAGVVAAATAICFNQEWRGGGAGHLAELVLGHDTLMPYVDSSNAPPAGTRSPRPPLPHASSATAPTHFRSSAPPCSPPRSPTRTQPFAGRHASATTRLRSPPSGQPSPLPGRTLHHVAPASTSLRPRSFLRSPNDSRRPTRQGTRRERALRPRPPRCTFPARALDAGAELNATDDVHRDEVMKRASPTMPHTGFARIDGYLPIEDSRLVLEGSTAALVHEGSAAWLCVPHIDDGPLFCSILGVTRRSAFRVAPVDVETSVQRYELDSGALVTEPRSHAGAAPERHFDPTTGELTGTYPQLFSQVGVISSGLEPARLAASR